MQVKNFFNIGTVVHNLFILIANMIYLKYIIDEYGSDFLSGDRRNQVSRLK